MNKFCKKVSLVGILILLCTAVIGVPKNGEHPPFLSEKVNSNCCYSRV